MRTRSLPGAGHRLRAAVLVALCLGTMIVAAPSPAGAGSGAAFYVPPSTLPTGTAGTIIRSEPVSAVAPARAWRIMYLSRDIHGRPIPLTGTVLSPRLPWTGNGQRPLVSLAEGTQGEGTQCAPSLTITTPVRISSLQTIAVGYELPAIDALLTLGIAVVVTDYQGLGIPGVVHTYGQNPVEANAVIDATRAAQHLTGSGIPAHGPVGFFGYSEGGGATAAVASRVGTYAPELNVAGTFSGDGVDLSQTSLNYIEGGLPTGYIGYYLDGLMYDFPQTRPIIMNAMNAAGRAMLAGVRDQCIFETAVVYGFKHTSIWTVSGQTIADMLQANPITRAAMTASQVGTQKPSAPVLVTAGANDDVIDPAMTHAFVNRWCDQGATVQMIDTPLPTVLPGTGAGHILNIFYDYPQAIMWLRDRFNGRPAPSTC
jgi:dienelactone hydrolase